MQKILKSILAISVFLALTIFVSTVSAEVTPPSFSSCSYDRDPGDLAHYESGLHQIVGGGLLSGSDDVYSEGSGNALQCFCPSEGTTGIQTVWWKVGDLSQDDIDSYTNQGWILVNGSQWNLENTDYLAKNSEFSCSVPTPTPTPTTPPGPPGPPPVCEGKDLGAWAPTITEIKRVDKNTVHVCWTASTPNADDYIVYYGMSRDNLPWNTKVENSQCVDLHEVPAGHVFIKVAATDNCVVGPYSTIDEQTPQVLAATISSLPKTGVPLFLVFGLTAIAGVGAYLYKHFRLV